MTWILIGAQALVLAGLVYLLVQRAKFKRELDAAWERVGVDEAGVPTWEGLSLLLAYRRWLISPPRGE